MGPPKRSAKKNTAAKSFFAWPSRPLQLLLIPLLFILVTLIKIGHLPLKTAFSLRSPAIKLFKTFRSKATRRLISKKVLIFRSHRGRPRKKPLFTFYFFKAKRFIYHLVPKRLRFRLALTLLILGFFYYSIILSKVITELPSPNQLAATTRPLTTQILDRKGDLLYQIYEGRNRTLIKLSDLPPDLVHATIAIEDKHFYSHPGVDFLGIIRALKTNLSEGKLEGASTITQQLIKNTLLTPDKTVSRKIKEALLAFWVERIYKKDEILQMYFNEAPYGGPAWGIEAASRMYFGKNSKDLTLSESAYLAGLPAAPTDYSPFGTHPEKGRQRQLEVLKRMVDEGYISKDKADEAGKVELTFNPSLLDIKAPHFVMYIRALLAQKYGERTVSQGGLKVITSLDLNIQQMAEKAVATEIDKLKELKVGNGAAMVTDAKTGEILAMVGSKNYFDTNSGNFNVALALRQPGSSIKPVTYVTGFKMGYSPGTVLLDTPTSFPSISGTYSPVNYDGRFHGPVSIRVALGSSYNVPAVKMLSMVGVPSMIQTAKDLGITTFDNPQSYGLSLTLGGGAVRLIDMMSVYNTFASNGTKHTPQAILKVTDSTGNILEDNQNLVGQKVLSEEVSYLINHVLADNQARTPAFGAKSLLEIPGKTVAVKTGTSDDKRDNWTFGYTPEYVVGVWVGNNDYSPMDPKLASGITGAAPIWHNIMAAILDKRPNLAFERPKGIVEVAVDGRKDLGIIGQNPKSMVEQRTTPPKEEGSDGNTGAITYSDQFSSKTQSLATQ